MRYKRQRTRRTRSLLQILIQSVTLFQICSSIDLTIISYPELELDFAEFQTEQDKDEIPDSSTEEVMNDLQQTCVDIQYAKTYELLTPDKEEPKRNFPTDYSQCENLSDSRTIEDVLVKIGDDFEADVPLFLCYKDPKFGYIYMTPGFGNEFKFLFSQADHQAYPVVYGLVESTPVVDELFLDQRHLEKFFVHAFRMYDSKPTSELSLSILNNNQHFRLCSLIEDARDLYRRQKEAEEEEEDEDEDENEEEKKEKERKRKLNVERRKRQIPVLEDMFDVTFHELDKLNPVYSNLDVVVSTLPCYSNGSELVFLLSENPLDASAIFVFERSINARTNRREISVVQHISDIAFLRNMDKFYKR